MALHTIGYCLDKINHRPKTTGEKKMWLSAVKLLLRIEVVLTIGWFVLVWLAYFLSCRHKGWRSRDETSTSGANGIIDQVARWLRRLVEPEKRFIRAMVIVVAGFVTYIAGVEKLHSWGREELRSFIAEHCHGIQVFVRGRQVNRVAEHLEVLASTQLVIAVRGSHPIDEFPIALVAPNGDRINLVLGQDSKNPLEYWVFFPPYGLNRRDEIGRTYTSLFTEK